MLIITISMMIIILYHTMYKNMITNYIQYILCHDQLQWWGNF